MTGNARSMLVRLVVTVLTVAAVGVGTSTITGPAHAASTDVGYEDFKYGPGMSDPEFLDPNLAPTASKPQSKLWFAQGSWWGVLQVPNTDTTTIHAYNASKHTWTSTGVVIDDRDEPTHADVLWDEDKQRLYVASAGRAGATGGIEVSRFRYDGAQKKYVLDGLRARDLTNSGVEAAVIAKDTKGRLWVAYTAPPEGGGAGRRVRVLASDPSQTKWDKFTPDVNGVPLDGTSIDKDDIASIIAHDGKISLVWSNQTADAEGNTGFYVARHPDTADPTAGWTGSTKIFGGPRIADDHINLTSAAGGPGGRVYAVVKSSADDGVSPNQSAELVWLLVSRPDGVWEKYVHSRVREHMTRPIVLLEPGAGLLHVFATSPVEGGVIYHKASEMSNPGFDSGRGEPFIRLAEHPTINNATSSKQNVTDASGLLVLATDQKTGHYAHNYVPRTAPQANFTWMPTSGRAPLDVQFVDSSTGAVDSWSWSFGDGTTSSEQNPKHTFNEGSWPVTLKTTNAAGSTEKTLHLTVNVAKPVASFTYTPQTGPAPLAVQFTDTSATTGGAPASWLWDFGDGTTSSEQHPKHTFTQMGTYEVRLTVTNLSGSSDVVHTIGVTVAKPVAGFSYTPSSGFAPLAVQFTDTSTGPPASWGWNFGDGATSTLQHPSHTYAAGGTYEVSLRVENPSGSSIVKKTITIGAHPQVPVVVLDEPSVGFTASPVVESAWHATTAAGEVAGYEVRIREVGSSRRAQWEDQGVTTTEQSLRLPARLGSTYCLQVRATNIAQETGAWSETRCTAVPLDDRDLAQRGTWRKVADAQGFMGTTLVTRDRGAKLSRSVTGTRVSLLVTKRANGGRVLVYRNGRLVKRVSLQASTTRSMRLVTIASTKRVTTARYTMVVASRGRPVTIDGMLVTRS